MNERIQRIEEKIAYLEHHVTQQDKAMLELAEDLARLRAELKILAARAGTSTGGEASADRVDERDERPPHY